MEWRQTTAKFDSKCRHCGGKINAGKPAAMRKKMTNGKWNILCSPCYKEGKPDFDKEAQIEIDAHTTIHGGGKPASNQDVSVSVHGEIHSQMGNLERILGIVGGGGRKTDILSAANEAVRKIDEDFSESITGLDPETSPGAVFKTGPSGESLSDDDIRVIKKATADSSSIDWDEAIEALNWGKTDHPQEVKAEEKEEKTDEEPAKGPKFTKKYIEQNPGWRI